MRVAVLGTPTSVETETKMPPRKKAGSAPKYITDRLKREQCFAKRVRGLFKKGSELHLLTGCDVLMVVVPETQGSRYRVLSYASTQDDWMRAWYDIACKVATEQSIVQAIGPSDHEQVFGKHGKWSNVSETSFSLSKGKRPDIKKLLNTGVSDNYPTVTEDNLVVVNPEDAPPPSDAEVLDFASVHIPTVARSLPTSLVPQENKEENKEVETNFTEQTDELRYRGNKLLHGVIKPAPMKQFPTGPKLVHADVTNKRILKARAKRSLPVRFRTRPTWREPNYLMLHTALAHGWMRR